MTQKGEIYKCEVCGNIVEMLHPGIGELVCCGQPMKQMQANTVDASKEKHVPVIEKTGTGTRVRVGTEPHPMESTHFIEWIELNANGTVYRKYLEPGQNPEAEFPTKAENAEARAYCNMHGLWKG